MAALSQFASGTRLSTTRPTRVVAPRTPLLVEANKKVSKTSQVVLKKSIPGTGAAGELVTVKTGFWRNYLGPAALAEMATPSVLAKIQDKLQKEQEAKDSELAKARAYATALSTINKFVIRKKVGEDDKIFGSVTASDVAEAMELQMGRKFEKASLTLPDMKTLGTYECNVQLHPQVKGTFSVVVQKEKEKQ